MILAGTLITSAVHSNQGRRTWFSSLIAALSRTEEEIESGKSASILILDDFDTEGDGNVNITNMKKFCHDMARLRDVNEEQYEIYVVVLTQSKEVANMPCKINNWQKIAPIPGNCNPPTGIFDESNRPDPDWTGLPWTDEQLKKMVNKRFKVDELADTDWETLCKPGKVLGQVLREVREKVRRKEYDVSRAQGDELS